MKIGFISNFSPYHADVEIADYLEEAGHDVSRYHYKRLHRGIFLAQSFDLVLTVLPQSQEPGFWRAVKETGAQLVAWYSDWIREPGHEEKYLARLKHFDLVCSSDGSSSEWYERHGIRRVYLQSACDTRTYQPSQGNAKYICDVAFVGHLRRLGLAPDGRQQLVDRLAKEFDFRHFGNGSEVYGPEHSVVCNSAKIMVCDNWRNDIPGYWSDRVYMEVGSAGFVLHPRVPGLEEHFIDGVHLVTYSGLDELCRKIRVYLDQPNARKRIAVTGWRHVKKNHSQQKRVQEFLECISA